jgi:hypothetical protein
MGTAHANSVPQTEWMSRCRSRIAEPDSELAQQDAVGLARALADRPSCRVLEPERTVDLLFQNRLAPSAWGRLDEES